MMPDLELELVARVGQRWGRGYCYSEGTAERISMNVQGQKLLQCKERPLKSVGV